MRIEEWSDYREGVTLDRPANKGTYVNVGLKVDARVQTSLQPGVRVTVKLDQRTQHAKKST